MLATLMASDVFRLVTIVLTLLVIATLPNAIDGVHRSRSHLLIVAVELYLISSALAVIYHLGDAIRWYRTPLIALADVLALTYVVRCRPWR